MFPDQPGTVVGVSGAFRKEPAGRAGPRDGLVQGGRPDQGGPGQGRAPDRGGARQGHRRRRDRSGRPGLAGHASSWPTREAIVEATRAMQAYQVKLGSLDKEIPARRPVRPQLLRARRPSRLALRIGDDPSRSVLPRLGLVAFLAFWEAIAAPRPRQPGLPAAAERDPGGFLREVALGHLARRPCWRASATTRRPRRRGRCSASALGVVTGMCRIVRERPRPGSCGCCARSPASPGCPSPSSGSASSHSGGGVHHRHRRVLDRVFRHAGRGRGVDRDLDRGGGGLRLPLARERLVKILLPAATPGHPRRPAHRAGPGLDGGGRGRDLRRHAASASA